jgi:hypothetical protein
VVKVVNAQIRHGSGDDNDCGSVAERLQMRQIVGAFASVDVQKYRRDRALSVSHDTHGIAQRIRTASGLSLMGSVIPRPGDYLAAPTFEHNPNALRATSPVMRDYSRAVIGSEMGGGLLVRRSHNQGLEGTLISHNDVAQHVLTQRLVEDLGRDSKEPRAWISDGQQDT